MPEKVISKSVLGTVPSLIPKSSSTKTSCRADMIDQSIDYSLYMFNKYHCPWELRNLNF